MRSRRAPRPTSTSPPLGFDGRVRLAELKGSPIVLGILDTRWPAFLDAVEGLERLNRALRRRGLAVVGVFVDADADGGPATFVGAQPVTFTPAHDPDAQAHRPQVTAGPRLRSSWSSTASGNVVARSLDVAAWRTAAFRKTLEPYVEPEKPGL